MAQKEYQAVITLTDKWLHDKDDPTLLYFKAKSQTALKQYSQANKTLNYLLAKYPTSKAGKDLKSDLEQIQNAQQKPNKKLVKKKF